MSLVRFEVEGTPEEVITHLEELMTPGRYYVKVSRKIEDTDEDEYPAADQGLGHTVQDNGPSPTNAPPGAP
jgi:hypothetical protein